MLLVRAVFVVRFLLAYRCTCISLFLNRKIAFFGTEILLPLSLVLDALQNVVVVLWSLARWTLLADFSEILVQLGYWVRLLEWVDLSVGLVKLAEVVNGLN